MLSEILGVNRHPCLPVLVCYHNHSLDQLYRGVSLELEEVHREEEAAWKFSIVVSTGKLTLTISTTTSRVLSS